MTVNSTYIIHFKLKKKRHRKGGEGLEGTLQEGMVCGIYHYAPKSVF